MVNLALTADEAAHVLNELYSLGHGHGSSKDDFEPECPSCTAADKLAAAIAVAWASSAPDEDKWALLARTGHLSPEVADAARKTAAKLNSTDGVPSSSNDQPETK